MSEEQKQGEQKTVTPQAEAKPVVATISKEQFDGLTDRVKKLEGQIGQVLKELETINRKSKF